MATARRNAELNGYNEERVQFVRGDMVGFLEAALERKEAYDVIILGKYWVSITPIRSTPPTLTRPPLLPNKHWYRPA